MYLEAHRQNCKSARTIGQCTGVGGPDFLLKGFQVLHYDVEVTMRLDLRIAISHSEYSIY